jgi:hypothetical protein
MAGIAAILPIFQAVGTVFSAVSQAGAQQDAGEAQARASEYNAAVARNNALAASQASEADAKTQDKINRQRLGAMEANLSASGVTMEGTPLLLLGEETTQGALETEKIRARGQTQARNFESQAQQQDIAASQSRSAAESRAGSTLLTGVVKGATTLGSRYLR